MKESSAFTRWRHDFALGLKPGLPGNINSRSTAAPWEQDKIKKKKKKKKKSKDKLRETYELTPLTLDDMKTSSSEDVINWYEKYGIPSGLGKLIGPDDEIEYGIDLVEKKRLQSPDLRLDGFLDKVGLLKKEKDELEKDTNDKIQQLDRKKKSSGSSKCQKKKN